MLTINPSDLKYRYPRDLSRRHKPKFQGLPDPVPFNRDDLYEILPMLGAVMDALGTNEARVLHLLEDILNGMMPRFIHSRQEVYQFLVETARDHLRNFRP